MGEDNPTHLDFVEWFRSILERVFTAELEHQGHPDLEFVFLRPATPDPDSHDDWRELNE